VLLILLDLLFENLKSKRGKLVMLKSVCVLFSLLFLTSLASAEIFKYVGRNGEDLYQNFPCQFESMGGTPTDVPAPKKSPTEVLGPKKLSTVPAEPRVGMTTDEVRAIWGERRDTVQGEFGNGSRFEVWLYGASRSVRFDRKRRVAAIQQ
jgi:Domain of unknown function (DUF4124)